MNSNDTKFNDAFKKIYEPMVTELAKEESRFASAVQPARSGVEERFIALQEKAMLAKEEAKAAFQKRYLGVVNVVNNDSGDHVRDAVRYSAITSGRRAGKTNAMLERITNDLETRVYANLSVGATRMDEQKVVKVVNNDSGDHVRDMVNCTLEGMAEARNEREGRLGDVTQPPPTPLTIETLLEARRVMEEQDSEVDRTVYCNPRAYQQLMNSIFPDGRDISRENLENLPSKIAGFPIEVNPNAGNWQFIDSRNRLQQTINDEMIMPVIEKTMGIMANMPAKKLELDIFGNEIEE